MKKGITNSLWYESYINKRTVWDYRREVLGVCTVMGRQMALK